MVTSGMLSGVVLARLAVAGIVCLAGAGGAAYVLLPDRSPDVVPAAFDARPAVLPATPPTVAPSFDVVRVGPGGSAVLAGRAEPGATVSVSDGTATLGEVRADARGEWVLVPASPLAPGGRELAVSARTDTGPVMKGGDTVVLAIPAPVAAPAPAMALLVPQSGAPRLLQSAPSPAAPGSTAPGAGVPPASASTRLALNAVDYDDRGAIRFTGVAPPGAPVRVYVDNGRAGDAVADAQGQWTLTPSDTMATGVHKLRVDHLTGAGKVQSRVELPFQRAALPAGDLASGRVVVQPGQNLWRLARRAYGSGVRYTVIYLANRDQIRDPGLIYPGQAFALPTAAP